MKKRCFGMFCTGLVFLLLTSAAQATFIGDDVFYDITVTSFDNSVSTGSGSATVGSGIEVDPMMPLSPWLALDVDASSFSFIYDDKVNRAIRKLEFKLSDLDWSDPSIQIVSAIFAVNDIDNAVSKISTTTDSVSIVLDNTNGDYFTWEKGDKIVVSIDTAPVPEPATILLLGGGLAGLAFYRRKRK